MISSAMNEIILKLFDYASQGLPCLLDNLVPLMACQHLSLVEQESGLEAANDIIQVSEAGWDEPSSIGDSQKLAICTDNSCALMLEIDLGLNSELSEPGLLVCYYDSSEAAEAAMRHPDLQELIPHIRQALFIAREISEQIGDIQALQYVIEHHPLKALFQNDSINQFFTSSHLATVPAANQAFEPEVSKQSLSHHFNLSPSEIELSQALFKGLSLNEITEARHVSKQTVRKQLQSILKKTGAQSQEALMLLLFDRCLLTGLGTPEKSPAASLEKHGPTFSKR